MLQKCLTKERFCSVLYSLGRNTFTTVYGTIYLFNVFQLADFTSKNRN